ncbi:receptor protein kinase-like protein ZAR1 [Amborella trichopoda]|uniref:Protein kinase domain-containing protein n=1 Tax=Amborella trichopoda TaxID=13333 RepID=W1PVJ0_AMBTC|nr:receptor protein kinase-like protein ZAR1 [Amborella trichopoda]ERN11706.1 hypothetical protein AMTR_s00022p00229730 [Amborella trichopoda]|eukprot:XP_020526445.1 receptor protein kinase-like protein ZAR1 [Amborella trichopoda]
MSLLLRCLFSLLFLYPLPSLSLNRDGLSLLALKSAITNDPNDVLSSWNETHETPCHWAGIQCISGQVAGISLSGHSLSGYLPSEIGALSHLRLLILRQNFFIGKLFPAIGNLTNLTHLDISDNQFNGSIPKEIGKLSQISGTLNLSCNRFSGGIPETLGNLPIFVSLDLTHNDLSGRIPAAGNLVNQGPTAFSGNPNLCGFPLNKPCEVSEVAGKVKGLPEKVTPKRRKGPMVLILAGNLAGAAALVILATFFCRKSRGGCRKCEKGGESGGLRVVDEAVVYGLERENGGLRVVDETFVYGLEDLLRACAYVVGKGKMGIVYKVVVADGVALAVRRVADGGRASFLGLGQGSVVKELEAMGRFGHPNLARLRAYYWEKDEKLLISEFISNGSLSQALHGICGLNRPPPLPWQSRLNIAKGAARGLAHLHEGKFVHGNIKSSKILLDENFRARISDFGLCRLFNFHHLPPLQRAKVPPPLSFYYLAPEARVPGHRPTQKSDIYALGIVLMELLTGRPPAFEERGDSIELASFVRGAFQENCALSEIVDPALLKEVYAKKEVLRVFHVALGCTEAEAELRPRMKGVSEALERVGEVGHL